MVSPAARRASARTMSATRSSAGDSEGLIPRRRMSSDALAAPAGDEAPSSVLGMGLRYGVAAGQVPAVGDEGVRCLLTVEQDGARDDAVGRLDLAAVDDLEGQRRPRGPTVGGTLEVEQVGLLRVEEEVEPEPG